MINKNIQTHAPLIFKANVTIINNTDYNIHNIVNEGNDSGAKNVDDAQIYAGKSYTYSSTYDHNTDAIVFVDPTTGGAFMQGSLSFGPRAGVYADRGWMQSQTIKMTIHANDVEWTQESNGGEEVIPSNGFSNGGTIVVKFDKM